LDPQEPEAHFHPAVTLRKLGQTAQANQELDRSNQLRAEMNSSGGQGMGQGMGRLRTQLPDLDTPPM